MKLTWHWLALIGIFLAMAVMLSFVLIPDEGSGRFAIDSIRAMARFKQMVGTSQKSSIEALGYCVVKIHGDTTGNCKSIPMNTWVADNALGGGLGKNATLNACRKRQWDVWCGSEVDYKIEARGYCMVRVLADSRGLCKNIPKREWFRDYRQTGNLHANGHLTACQKRDWATRCGVGVEYKIEASFAIGERVVALKPIRYPSTDDPITVPVSHLGIVAQISPKLGVRWDSLGVGGSSEELLHAVAVVYPDQIMLVKEVFGNS